MRTHGQSGSREYKLWQQIKIRCTNPKAQNYSAYGGRGIAVCPRWADSFEAFISDMGPRPSPDHSVERNDNNGPYSPNNCRWASKMEQGQNKRNSHHLTLNGETMTISAWSRRTGLVIATILRRLQMGRSVEDALTTRPIHRPVTYQGRTQSLLTWSKELGMSYSAVRRRLVAGWSADRAFSEPFDKVRDGTGRYKTKH